MDFLKNNEELKRQRERTVTLKMTVGDVVSILGEENVKDFIEKKTAEAAYKKEYDMTAGNIISNWMMLCLFIFAFALMSTIALELIDRDKR